ncbi:hypothetical protein HYH03_009455 [Edaphochlamys debaryana]|uniref:Uncharacterized protein n=1 Tax=Edaphochlamys debaryana TaxID=47281 RepID=A0A835XYQ7_9CHLO|nr:hypothetical protein HYH03_009455 [Edaphochlamys debaryana]|eukprot:KAG2492209.1 hypothetical protein HYH03_009455 [Edaphochlamys debaryana]
MLPSPGPTGALLHHALPALGVFLRGNAGLCDVLRRTGTSRRHVSSSSDKSQDKSQQRPGALAASKSRVLPFSLTAQEAENEYEAHHSGLLTAQPGGWDRLKTMLLPFWCVSTEAQVHVQSAQIGHTRLRPASRGRPAEWVTDWYTVAPDWRYERRWSAESLETQVYAGAKYRHDPAIDKMKPGEYVRQALPYGDYISRADSGRAVEPDRVVPFQMSPLAATEAVRNTIRAAEQRTAEEQLRKMFGGDRVQLVVMDVQLSRLAATPVFAPAFVFKTRIRGTAMRTYVAGYKPGLSSGPLLPNPSRVASLAAGAGMLASGALVPFSGGPLGWTLGAVVWGAIGYAAAIFWPELHAGFLGLRARLQRPLPSASAEEQEAWWRYEWVRQDPDEAFGYDSEGRYSGTYRSRKEYGRRQQQQQRQDRQARKSAA